jgi:hypothetical protein
MDRYRSYEAHTPAWLTTRSEMFQRFAAKYHMTTAAELASTARPRLLGLYHHGGLSAEELMHDMLARYLHPGSIELTLRSECVQTVRSTRYKAHTNELKTGL